MKLGGKERSLTLTHVFQLDFDSFDLEESDTCLYDSLTILADVEGAEEIGRRNPAPPDFFCALMCALGIKVGICVVVVVVFVAVMCGGSVPPPVLSYHSLMVLHFVSDGSVARRGFHATVAFISHAGAWATCVKDPHTRDGCHHAVAIVWPIFAFMYAFSHRRVTETHFKTVGAYSLVNQLDIKMRRTHLFISK